MNTEAIKTKEYHYTTEQVNINQIQSGDTIIHEDKLTTVSKSNIKRCDFLGTTIFGDSYHAGNKKVTRVHFINYKSANA